MNFSTIKALSIPEGIVTKIEFAGNIIWQVAETISYKNWVEYAVETDGTTIYNGGLGYKDGYRVSSSGSIKSSTVYGTCTGYIPFTGGNVIYLSGVEWASNEDDSQKAIAFYDSSFGWLGTATYQQNGAGLYYGICNNTTLKFSCVNGITTFQTPTNTSIAYVVISGVGSGEDMIVTINEEIN